SKFNLLTIKDIGFLPEIPETGNTLHENALIKSNTIHTFCGKDCFSDDTGLEVEALQGAPGVYSARFAGENASYAENVNKLLFELNGIANRKACFKTVVSLNFKGKNYFFEG